MRSLSNLIKSAYFNVTSDGQMRVIDSDQKVEEYVPELTSSPLKELVQSEEAVSETDIESKEFESGLTF